VSVKIMSKTRYIKLVREGNVGEEKVWGTRRPDKIVDARTATGKIICGGAKRSQWPTGV
jgi:hypothetical protein